MKTSIKTFLLPLLVLALLIAGCTGVWYIALKEDAPQETVFPVEPMEYIPMRVRSTRVRLPESKRYVGEDVTVRRRMFIIRFFSPFGLGAGEVVSNMEPAGQSGGTTPEVVVGPGGISIGESERGTTTGGADQSWLSKLWVRVKGLLLWGVGIVGGVIALFIAIPVTRVPVLSILKYAGKGIASLIPIFGSIISGLGKKKVVKEKEAVETALVQVVEGNENFKATGAGSVPGARAAFATEQDKAQDHATKDKVDEVQAAIDAGKNS